MKKKINISVFDIVHKVSSPKNVMQVENQQPLIVVDKPVRFQDLYKKVMIQQGKNGQPNPLKIVYDSKKTTPLNTNRYKKNSAASLINKSTVSSVANSRKKSIPFVTSSQRRNNIQLQKKQGSKQKTKNFNTTVRNSKQKNKQNISQISNSLNQSIKKIRNSSKKIKNQIDQCFKFLNHEEHSHLRQGNQCFLSERQIDVILSKLGYNLKHPKYSSFLALLQVDIYGGAPSQNLRQVLKIIESSNKNIKFKVTQTKTILPKIIDNNLQIKITPQNQKIIGNYFFDFKQYSQIKTAQKQQQNLYTNYQPLNQLENLQNILNQRDISSSLKITKQFNYSSPDKKITNAAIYQLIQALSQSGCKKSQKNKSAQKLLNKINLSNKKQSFQQDFAENNLGTFRKIQAPMTQSITGQYNFSRQLSGDKKLQPCEDDNIIQLKNRLNQALKKSNLETNHFIAQDHQYPNFIYANATRYTRKPILSIDVNLGQGISQKIMVYEGQTAKQVAQRLSQKFTINIETKNKFEKMLQTHLNTVLWKIDQVSQQMLTDREP